jgi:hypothetical protein
MKRPQEFIHELMNEQLYNAFEEIEELNKNGILPDGIIRDVTKRINQVYNNSFDIDYVCKEVVYEIAKRWYKEGL